MCVCVCVCAFILTLHIIQLKSFRLLTVCLPLSTGYSFHSPGARRKWKKMSWRLEVLGGATVGVKDEHRVSGELIAFLLAGIFNFEF